MSQATKTWLRDVAERTIATFLQSFIGLLLASEALDIDAIKAAGVAALIATLSFLKGVLARRYGPSDSAALINNEGKTSIKGPRAYGG